MKYYAWYDTNNLIGLGDCKDFDEADAQTTELDTPGYPHWIFNQDELVWFVEQALVMIEKE